jgi:putative membrane protein
MIGGMHSGFFGGMGGFGLLGALIGLFFFSGIVLLIGAVVVSFMKRGTDARTSREPGSRTALDVLEERYARGELSREEFLRVREDLS